MAVVERIEYEDSCEVVRNVYDDIKVTRQTGRVNNFWKTLAFDPGLLSRTWESVKTVMAPGFIDPLTKELIYIAVSVTNGCTYCIKSHIHSARLKGMTEGMLSELMSVIGLANQTNALSDGFQIEVDDEFHQSKHII